MHWQPAAIARCLDVQPESISSGLEKVTPVAGRLQRKVSSAGIAVIDDSYNANPASASAAIKVLSELEGERVLILGDMRELGEGAEALHEGSWQYCSGAGRSQVVCGWPACGRMLHMAFGQRGMSFTDKQQLLNSAI